MQEKSVVFDLGMHNGDDTAYYLERGFKVIAVEANAGLCDECNLRFESRISHGDLFILNKAIWEKDGRIIDFYISSFTAVPTKSEQSTITYCF